MGVPLTATVAESVCAVVTLNEPGVTVTVGVSKGTVTVTADDVPEALLYVDVLFASGVYFAVKVSDPAASEPAAIVIDADPAASAVEADV